MKRSVIVSAKRTPMGRFMGSLSKMPAPRLGAEVAKVVLAETKALDGGVDEVIVGQVLQAAVGQNPARQVALGAGVPDSINAWTVNKVCGSSLESVMQANRAIRCGDAKVVLAGGIESMSMAPFYVSARARSGMKFGAFEVLDGMQYDGLTCPFEKWLMGCAADLIAEQRQVSREDQDRFAMESHRKTAAAWQAGNFKAEVVPIEVPRKGPFNQDETYREQVSLEDMAKLKPVFTKGGTVTAGNASQISDGAGMVLVAEAEEAKRRGWKPLVEILSQATHGVAPKELFIAPVEATRKAVDGAGLSLSDIDLFELNEAFAAQSLACSRALELKDDDERVNVNGGAIALGHPIGASGTRVLVTLIHAMMKRNKEHGVACLCLGGGNAVAMVVRRV